MQLLNHNRHRKIDLKLGGNRRDGGSLFIHVVRGFFVFEANLNSYTSLKIERKPVCPVSSTFSACCQCVVGTTRIPPYLNVNYQREINPYLRLVKIMKNINHPRKGSRITVEPIRRLQDIKAIQKMLAGNPRDNLLFTLGVNCGLRVGDLLKLKVKDIAHLKPGQHIIIRESKTSKDNILAVNKAAHKTMTQYLDNIRPDPEDLLFASRKGEKALTIQSVNNLVKKWTGAINLRGNYGAHSLRKTWGYIQRVEFGVGFEVIAKRYLHSNPAVTMRYLGIQDKEVHGTLMNEIG